MCSTTHMYEIIINQKFKAVISHKFVKYLPTPMLRQAGEDKEHQVSIVRIAVTSHTDSINAKDSWFDFYDTGGVLPILISPKHEPQYLANFCNTEEKEILSSPQNTIWIFEYNEIAFTCKAFVEILQKWGLSISIISYTALNKQKEVVK